MKNNMVEKCFRLGILTIPASQVKRVEQIFGSNQDQCHTWGGGRFKSQFYCQRICGGIIWTHIQLKLKQRNRNLVALLNAKCLFAHPYLSLTTQNKSHFVGST